MMSHLLEQPLRVIILFYQFVASQLTRFVFINYPNQEHIVLRKKNQVMQVVALLVMFLFHATVHAAEALRVGSMTFTGPSVVSMYPGETVKLPLRARKEGLWGTTMLTCLLWPQHIQFEAGSDNCPSVPKFDDVRYADGACLMNLVITGTKAGQVIQGRLHLHLLIIHSHHIYSPYFTATVIPHPISMLSPGKARAIAGKPFNFSFKNYIRFFDENVQGGATPQGIVSPQKNNGLYFNPSTYAIVGTPEHIGTTTFRIAAKTNYGTAAAVELVIDVGLNKENKPKFKPSVELAAVNPGKPYQLALMDLVDMKQLAAGDQLHFRLEPHQNDSDLFKIDPANDQLLIGHVPLTAAGQTLQVTVVAHSNTGGDSEPLTLTIPVAFDPALRPSIKPVTLFASRYDYFYQDIASLIDDPSGDGSLKLILEKVEPAAPWLGLSMHVSTALEGLIPAETTGMHYTLYLRATTMSGGSSELVKGSLTMKINPNLTPQFKSSKPILPILQPGTAYKYCIDEHRDVWPEYEDHPYTLELAEGSDSPDWLEIKDNCIEAQEVPLTLANIPLIWVVLRNIPGGAADPMPLELPVAGLM